ncbi:Zinc-binding dehydrogenase [Ceratobasidium sp. AG-Ba]|nr:Zinc-binding dehydrogenase [Ceratobasidium sp. AG-Ba]QRW12878.1 Zinc-binding dehydrogenase [Ceratobasidium sp. AG-Ba]
MVDQKASVLPALNGNLVVEVLPRPTPSIDEVLVKVTAAAVNPLDNLMSHFKIFAILGCDGAGVVEAVGTGVQGFKKGDRVFFQADFKNDYATFQQYSLANARQVGHTPSNVTDEQASTLPSSLATAVAILFDKTGIAPLVNGPTVSGIPIVILGGSGSVGRTTIQLARIAGFSLIVTTSSNAHADALRSLGATHVFDRNVSVETIHSAVQSAGHPLHFVVDAVSTPETQLFAYKLLTSQLNSPAGELQLRLVLPPTEQLIAANEARAEGPIKLGMVDGSAYALPELNAPFWAIAGKWIEEGELVPASVQVVEGGLAAVPEALDIIAKGVSGVKLVIRPHD